MASGATHLGQAPTILLAWCMAGRGNGGAVRDWVLVLATPATRGREPAKFAAGSAASEISEVAEGDLAGALSTMSLAGSTIARLQKNTRDCGSRLAWVTLSRLNDDTPRTVRLRSGSYYSPAFAVTKTPDA